MPNQNNSHSRPRTKSRAWLEVRKSRVELPPLKGSYKTQPCHSDQRPRQHLPLEQSTSFDGDPNNPSTRHQGQDQKTRRVTPPLKKCSSLGLGQNGINFKVRQEASSSHCREASTPRVCFSKLPDTGGPEDISFLKNKLGLTMPDKEAVLQADSKSVQERSQVLRRRELVRLPAVRPNPLVAEPQEIEDEDTLQSWKDSGEFSGFNFNVSTMTAAERVRANKRRLRAEKADRRMTLAKKSRFNVLNAEFKRSKLLQDKSELAAKQTLMGVRNQIASIDAARQADCGSEVLEDVEVMRQKERQKSKAAIERITKWKLKFKQKRKSSVWELPPLSLSELDESRRASSDAHCPSSRLSISSFRPSFSEASRSGSSFCPATASRLTSPSSKKKLGKRRDTQDPGKSGSDGVDSIISRMSSLRMSLVNKNLQQVSFMKNVALEETGSEVSEGGLSCDTDLLSLRHSNRCFKRH